MIKTVKRFLFIIPVMIVTLMLSSLVVYADNFSNLPIIDEVGIVNDELVSYIKDTNENKLKDADLKIGLAILNSTGKETIESYSRILGNKLEYEGKLNDKSLLLVIVPSKREMRIEVAKSVEKDFSESQLNNYLDILKPYFRDEDYQTGIISMFNRLSQDRINSKSNVVNSENASKENEVAIEDKMGSKQDEGLLVKFLSSSRTVALSFTVGALILSVVSYILKSIIGGNSYPSDYEIYSSTSNTRVKNHGHTGKEKRRSKLSSSNLNYESSSNYSRYRDSDDSLGDSLPYLAAGYLAGKHLSRNSSSSHSSNSDSSWSSDSFGGFSDGGSFGGGGASGSW